MNDESGSRLREVFIYFILYKVCLYEDLRTTGVQCMLGVCAVAVRFMHATNHVWIDKDHTIKQAVRGRD